MSGKWPFLRLQADGVSLQVKVVPRASRNEIGEVLGDRLKIKIAAPPVDSAANEELVTFLAKRLDVTRQAVCVAHGKASRNKTVLVQGLTPDAVAAKLTG